MDGNGGDAPAAPAEQEQPKEGTFFIPSSPELAEYGPGDTIMLKVVGKDTDGQLEVECQHDDQPGQGMEGIKSDFRKHMAGGSEEGGE